MKELPKQIDTLVPFSFRQPVKDLKDIRMVNDFAAVGVQLAIEEKFETALDRQKKINKDRLRSLAPFSALILVQMNVNLPFNIPQLSIDWMTDQYSLVFSNLNASKVPFIFDGKK